MEQNWSARVGLLWEDAVWGLPLGKTLLWTGSYSTFNPWAYTGVKGAKTPLNQLRASAPTVGAFCSCRTSQVLWGLWISISRRKRTQEKQFFMTRLRTFSLFEAITRVISQTVFVWFPMTSRKLPCDFKAPLHRHYWSVVVTVMNKCQPWPYQHSLTAGLTYSCSCAFSCRKKSE